MTDKKSKSSLLYRSRVNSSTSQRQRKHYGRIYFTSSFNSCQVFNPTRTTLSESTGFCPRIRWPGPKANAERAQERLRMVA